MFLGRNLYFLRKRSGITQEVLAQKLKVSRQAVSKWESGEVIPEVGKLLELADLFGCKMDALLREDLTSQPSDVEFFRIKPFSMVSYEVISANPVEDAAQHLRHWADKNGLPHQTDREIGWSFLHVSQEQKQRFGLRGYVCARILPEGFLPRTPFPQVTHQGSCCYARLTYPEPNGRDPVQVACAIRTILEALHACGIDKSAEDGYLPCFERRCVKQGKRIAEVYIQCRDAGEIIQFTEKEL